MESLEIRRIGPGDWREFRTIRLAALHDAPVAFGSTYAQWVAADERRWRERLTAVPFTVVAQVGGDAVGVASGLPDDRGVQLISMWVHPEKRGHGVAHRLIEEVTGWAAARGAATYLMVRDDNEAAIRCYRRAGFIDRGVPAGWPDGEPAEREMWQRRPTEAAP